MYPCEYKDWSSRRGEDILDKSKFGHIEFFVTEDTDLEVVITRTDRKTKDFHIRLSKLTAMRALYETLKEVFE